MFFSNLFKSKHKPQPSAAEPVLSSPLIVYAEMELEHTRKGRIELHKKAKVTDQSGNVFDFFEAIEKYYNSPDAYYSWTFPITDIQISRAKTTYDVYGDGILLGQVFCSRYNDSYVRMLDDLILINKIDHFRIDAKDGRYFHLTKAEYEQYVHFDPYNRGYPHWADDKVPKIKLYVYFEDGILNYEEYGTKFSLPDPDELLKEKET